MVKGLKDYLYVNGVTQSDKLTVNFHLTLQFKKLYGIFQLIVLFFRLSAILFVYIVSSTASTYPEPNS